MDIAPFGVEDWLNVHEKSATYDIAQSTIASMTLDELVALGAAPGIVADGAEAAFPQDARAGAAQMGFFARLGAEKMNYGWIEGSPAFKRAAAALYGRVEPEAVLQTNGATGANLLAALALVSRGDHVVAEYPSYQQLYDIPRALGAEVDLWRIHEDRGWYPDLDELERLVRPDTRLICLNNANNPTGTFLDRAFMEQVADIARSVGAFVLVDEVYLPLVGTEDFASIADIYERGVATNSLSKTYSVPGARIGWTASSPQIAEMLRPYRDYTMICCGVVNDALAVHVLEHRDAVLARNRSLVMGNLAIAQAWIDDEPRVSWVAPQGVSTSCIKLDIPEDDEAFCLRLLEDEGVLLVPDSRFDLPGHARLGYCAPEPVLRAGLAGLGRALRRFD